MAIDTPARLAVLGAGPLGLEAALYARFLGYDVDIFEQADVAANVRRWGDLPLPGTFAEHSSTLGLAALAAQDPDYRPPAPTQILTGNQWADAYLVPLAQSDLLADHLRLGTKVIAVGRPHRRKADDPGTEDRREDVFRLLVSDSLGNELATSAHAVLDATGTRGQPSWIGAGGLPAIGERACRDQIDYGLTAQLSRGRTLLVGDGPLVALALKQFAFLANESATTSVTWLTAATADDLDQYRQNPPAWLDVRPDSAVDAVRWSQESPAFRVRFTDAAEEDDSEEAFDRILALTGDRPDESITSELQLLRSPLDASLVPPPFSDPVFAEVPLASYEPDYYVLGAKSYGRRAGFTYAAGLKQIRQIFAILGDRPTLDLYANAPKF